MNLSAGQLVVVVLAVVAIIALLSRPQVRAYWRETPPMRRAAIILLGVVAVLAVAWVAGSIQGTI